MPSDDSPALASLLSFSAEDLAAWVGVRRTDQGGAPAVAGAALWLRFLTEELPLSEEEIQEQVDAASRAADAAAVISMAVLRALAACSRGDITRATDAARRASLMAQAEGLPQQEFLAALALARARRHAGHPHLAVHILSALARVAPAPWWPWIAWEVGLSGGIAQAIALVQHADFPGPNSCPAARAARALAGAIPAARDGDRRGFEGHIQTALEATAGFTAVHQEAQVLAAVLDTGRTSITPAVSSWRDGDTTAVPAGLDGLGAGSADSGPDDTTIAYVHALPGRPGRRLLRPGIGLVKDAQQLPEESQVDRGGDRTDSAIAAAALAGPDGLSREDFFRRVYGFTFVGDLHQAILDVLVHRMRARLQDLGEISRGDQMPRVVLALHRPLLVADGRCALPIADRVLRAIVSLGAASAGDAAKALQMPLRTVQRALSQLVADGACSSKRAGNVVRYRVQDTTFTGLTGYLDGPPTRLG